MPKSRRSPPESALNASGLHPEWFNFCAPTGNFNVQFTGTLNGAGPLSGLPAASLFAEIDTASNYTGWQGIDPNGWSENATYDVHSGLVSGVLANIYQATINELQVPEPTTISLFGAGLGALGIARRRRKA